MARVIGVRFEKGGKLYFFEVGEIETTLGGSVIVETASGMAMGEVCSSVQEISEESLNAPLKPVLRLADENDAKHLAENQVKEKEAYAICQQKIIEHKLDMKLVSVKYTFDNNKILFYFTANGRVDFRGLVKDLAATFHTRIELRQIGVRDEARMLGGLGACGRTVCCRAFLGDFQPVSIKMAKEQNLSLNPTKISGVCGRLMCCLKYEEDDYEETRRRMPRIGKEVITPDGTGTVADLNIITERVKVRIQKGDAFELKEFPLTAISRPGMPLPQPKPEENDSTATTELQPADVVEQAEPQEQPAAEKREHRRHDRPRHHDRADRSAEGQKASKSEEKAPEKRERRPEPVRRVAKKPSDRTPSQSKLSEAQKPIEKQAAPSTANNNWKAAVEQALKAAQEQ